MRYVVYLIIVGTATVNVEDAEGRSYVAACERVGRIKTDDSVDHDAVGVHLGRKGLGSELPIAVSILLHQTVASVCGPVSKYLYLFSLRGIDDECNGVVFIDYWGCDVSLSESDVLLCCCAYADACCDQGK